MLSWSLACAFDIETVLLGMPGHIPTQQRQGLDCKVDRLNLEGATSSPVPEGGSGVKSSLGGLCCGDLRYQ